MGKTARATRGFLFYRTKMNAGGRGSVVAGREREHKTCLSVFPTGARPIKRVTWTASTLA